uniref:N-acetyltransferase domain-containing protein n=2 Tax=Plectus sambesii TaxID=2011161 RepID=A0A914XD17_9BILA
MPLKIPRRKYNLDRLEDVRARQVPKIPGEPIPMTEFECELPKNCGQPWIGAYSKHGFWYKFEHAEQKDFDKVVAYSIDTDQWLLQYKDYEVWKNGFGNELEIVVAKNQRDEVMGAIAFAKLGTSRGVIGLHWMMEDYRHSGIGMQLFKYAMKVLSGRNVCVNAVSHLSNKVRSRFVHAPSWRIDHIIVDKPKGLKNLKTEISAQILSAKDVDMKKVSAFDDRITGGQFMRDKWLAAWLHHPDGHGRVAVTQRGEVCGFGMVREAAGGWTKRLVVGPLYAQDERVAMALLYELLMNYYDPEERPDWNPNLQAIESREVHFFCPTSNNGSTNQRLLRLAGELKGEEGDVIEHARFWHQPLFTEEAIDADADKVFCVSDWHLAVI